MTKPYVLRNDEDGCMVWVRYALEEDFTNPWFLEYVTAKGRMMIRARYRTMKAACNSYYYSDD